MPLSDLVARRTRDAIGEADALLPEEVDFYQTYSWCLDPHLTVGEAMLRLKTEIGRLAAIAGGWRSEEIALNVFLLACAVSNAIDEHLRGPTLRMPRPLARIRLARGVAWATERLVSIDPRSRRTHLRRWREVWRDGLDKFLDAFVTRPAPAQTALAAACEPLATALDARLPAELCAARIAVPSAFRRLDLTHWDILALAAEFAARRPDKSQPILVIGLRTAGSYFAPLMRAFLAAAGYKNMSMVTVQPDKGPGRDEWRLLKRSAAEGCVALIVDDPPHTGGTFLLALDVARRAGFAAGNAIVAFAAHSAGSGWSRFLPKATVISLAPEEWLKRRLMAPEAAERRLDEYFRRMGYLSVKLSSDERADELNARLAASSTGERGARMKRIYSVRLRRPDGGTETRFVLAKSVGWGWLGYHAFLAGQRLTGFVPPLLGLREGILYTEWILESGAPPGGSGQRATRVNAIATYVAARVCTLSLPESGPARALGRHEAGLRLLEKTFAAVHGPFLSGALARAHLQRRLAEQTCPFPTLIDGRMDAEEWIAGSHGWLKSDFEHHGMGKNELNLVDPACDLAAAILDFDLSPDEEKALIDRYVAESGDASVERRLFMGKLVAGLWAMESARERLFERPVPAERQQHFHRQFLRAWNFLTVEAAHQSGRFCEIPQELGWRSPLVVLDVDGVLDRRPFGFPCTSAAGVEALSLLHAQGLSVALNTARSIEEVKAYCHAYSLAGGVAEHGAYLWDAVTGRGRALIDIGAMEQLERLRAALCSLPGVFLDERHAYSIRAFTYRKRQRGGLAALLQPLAASSGPAPLDTLTMNHLMASLRLDRLAFHHTTIDTTVVAKTLDKGSGLTALRDWKLGPEAVTIAVGDSEPDLAMFGVASRSFAPAHIDCARQARLLGCEVATQPYQRGLLEIVRRLTARNGGQRGRLVEPALAEGFEGLFWQTLLAADRPAAVNFIRAVSRPGSLRALFRA